MSRYELVRRVMITLSFSYIYLFLIIDKKDYYTNYVLVVLFYYSSSQLNIRHVTK